jgi:hypothetical protein
MTGNVEISDHLSLYVRDKNYFKIDIFHNNHFLTFHTYPPNYGTITAQGGKVN